MSEEFRVREHFPDMPALLGGGSASAGDVDGTQEYLGAERHARRDFVRGEFSRGPGGDEAGFDLWFKWYDEFRALTQTGR